MKLLSRPTSLMLNCVLSASMAIWYHGSAQAQISADLSFSNGQTMPVNIEDAGQQSLKVNSPVFEGAAELDVANLDAVRFRSFAQTDPSDETSDSKAPKFQLRLTTGEVIVGELNSIDEQQVSVIHSDLGEVVLPINQITMISPIRGQKQRLCALDLPIPNCNVRAGKLGAMQFGPQDRLECPFKLQSDAQVTIDFNSKPGTEFRVLLKSDKETLTTLTLSTDGVMAQTGDALDFADIKLLRGNVRLTFLIEGQQLTLRDALGREVLRQPISNEAPPTIEVINDGPQLEVLAFEFNPMHPATPTVDADVNIVLIDRSGKTFTCDALAVENGIVQANGGAVPADGIAFNDLADIVFPNHQPAQSSAPFASGHWTDGTRLAIDKIKVQQSTLFLQHETLIADNPLQASAMSALFFAPENKLRNSTAQQLTIGTTSFAGEFEWGKTGSPLWWKFTGFKNAVPLDLRRKILVSQTRELTTQEDDVYQGDAMVDRVMLKNGTILPCKIQTVIGNAIQLKSPYCESGKILRTQLRGCFFNVGTSFDSGSTTRESIGRALTVPRFSRDVEPTDMLIANNGDLLRCNLISVEQDKIELDSRAELLRIDRSRVKAIVALNEPAGDDDPSTEMSSSNEISIDYGNNLVLVGTLKRDDSGLVLNVPGCGQISLPNQAIVSICCNASRNDFSPLYRYAGWSPVASTEPRWAKPPAPNKDAQALVGKIAPGFKLPTLAGDDFALSDQRGKVILLSFWATWCRPCLMGMPDYLKTVEGFSSEEVIFVPINQAETSSVVREFLADKDWKMTIPMDINNEVASKYRVNAIPHLVVVDTQGKIAHVGVGYSPKNAKLIKTMVEELLEK